MTLIRQVILEMTEYVYYVIICKVITLSPPGIRLLAYIPLISAGAEGGDPNVIGRRQGGGIVAEVMVESESVLIFIRNILYFFEWADIWINGFKT